uniref:Cytosol aminopeptidase domain-containing protein n=1 Tax=Quercus lobata TaxID=97700 RepID=A0A7N2R8F4_QUELO
MAAPKYPDRYVIEEAELCSKLGSLCLCLCHCKRLSLILPRGGYNIKPGPGCSIELMKFDMGGSAAVLGAAKAIGQIKPSGVEVHFIVAACENMISGTGMRPGDIVTASNGKTIEKHKRVCLYLLENPRKKESVDSELARGHVSIFTPGDDLAKEVIAALEASGRGGLMYLGA